MRSFDVMGSTALTRVCAKTAFAVRGIFASDSGIVGDPKGDFAAALLQEVPTGSATMFMLSSGMPSEPATDTIIHWFEEAHLSGRTTLAEALDDNETGVDVADGSSVVAGTMMLLEDNGEIIYVTAVNGNTLTVVRGFAGTTAAAATSGTGVQRIATAHEEASARPTAVANQGYARFNYVQIFRNAWNLSGTAKALEYYTGPKMAKTRKDAALLHAEDIERALLFGRKTTGVVGGVRFSTMDGMDAQVMTNVTAAGSTTDWNDVDVFLRAIFEKNIKGKPNERVALGGNGALAVLGQIARIEGTMNMEAGQTDFGLRVTKWYTPYGDISVLTHPLMNENPLWTKDLRVFHPGACTIKWLRKTFEDNYDKDGTRAGTDADFGIYTSEMSFKYDVEKTAGRLTGLTEGVAVP